MYGFTLGFIILGSVSPIIDPIEITISGIANIKDHINLFLAFLTFCSRSFLESSLFSSVTYIASYPAFLTAFSISSIETFLPSYLTFISSTARFTGASSTPSNLLTTFSTLDAHDAQVIPFILKCA